MTSLVVQDADEWPNGEEKILFVPTEVAKQIRDAMTLEKDFYMGKVKE